MIKCDLGGNDRALETRYGIPGNDIFERKERGLLNYRMMPEQSLLPRIYSHEDYFATNYFLVNEEEQQTDHYKQMERIVKLAKKHCSNEGKLLGMGSGKGYFSILYLKHGVKCEGF